MALWIPICVDKTQKLPQIPKDNFVIAVYDARHFASRKCTLTLCRPHTPHALHWLFIACKATKVHTSFYTTAKPASGIRIDLTPRCESPSIFKLLRTHTARAQVECTTWRGDSNIMLDEIFFSLCAPRVAPKHPNTRWHRRRVSKACVRL